MAPEVIENEIKQYHEYAVKVVCGYQKEEKYPQVHPGAYFTAINVHNPGPKEAKFRVKIAVAAEGGAGAVSSFVTFSLRDDEALELDCALLHKIGGIAMDTFLKGFAVIQCRERLDIVAVYTAGDGKTVSTMHQERVAGTLMREVLHL